MGHYDEDLIDWVIRGSTKREEPDISNSTRVKRKLADSKRLLVSGMRDIEKAYEKIEEIERYINKDNK